MVIETTCNDENISKERRRNERIKMNENSRYHCNIIPAINGNNNLIKGAAFQMGIWYGCMV
jgi:hypothetical protein